MDSLSLLEDFDPTVKDESIFLFAMGTCAPIHSARRIANLTDLFKSTLDRSLFCALYIYHVVRLWRRRHN